MPAIDGLNIRATGAPSRSSQVTIINGRRTENSSTTYAYQVTPSRAGTFEIPALEIQTTSGVERTRPIRFSATKSDTGNLMFAKIIGNGDKVFVGQPIESTLMIWIKPFVDRRSRIKLSAEQMWQLVSDQSEWGSFQPVLEEMANSGQRISGREVLRTDDEGIERSYYLYEIDATIYPKSAGKLTGQEVQVVYQYPLALGSSRDPFDSFFENSPFGGMGGSSMASQFFGGNSPFGRSLTIAGARPIAVTPDVSSVEITAIPSAGQPADYRGAVGQYSIGTQASPAHVKAGDPITLQIGIRGTGPMELVQAPPLQQIPSLATDFKVTDESLAGILQGNVKVFATTIRPRHENVTQIPAIPFSFFDPSSEQFVTVKSAPIQIQVDKAETLALDSIVGNSGAAKSDGTQQTASTPTLSLENTDSTSVLRSSSAFGPTQLWWLLLLPPIAWLAVSTWRIRRDSRSHEFAKTVRKIRNVDSSTELADAVQRAINRQQGNHQLSLERCVPNEYPSELQVEIRNLFTTCDQYAYVGSDDRSITERKKIATDVVRSVERSSQPSSSSRILKYSSTQLKNFKKSPVRTAGFIAMSAIIFFAVSMAFAQMFGITNKSAVAMHTWGKHSSHLQLDDTQRAILLDEAYEAYLKGLSLKSESVVEAKLAFEVASRKYQMLADSGISNSELYRNLGNSYLQEGALGKAMANYERAIRLNPLNFDAANNLRLANERIAATESSTESLLVGFSIKDAAKRVMEMIPIWTIWTLFGLAWLAIWSVLIIRSFDLSCSARLNRRVMAASLGTILFTCCLIVVEGRMTEFYNRPMAIVTDSTADVRIGCGDEFRPANGFDLKEGSKYRVLQKRGDWCQVQTKSGTKGWVKADSVEIVSNT